MNRFSYGAARLSDQESFICRELGVKIYDGDEKVHNLILLNTHKFFSFSDSFRKR